MVAARSLLVALAAEDDAAAGSAGSVGSVGSVGSKSVGKCVFKTRSPEHVAWCLSLKLSRVIVSWQLSQTTEAKLHFSSWVCLNLWWRGGVCVSGVFVKRCESTCCNWEGSARGRGNHFALKVWPQFSKMQATVLSGQCSDSCSRMSVLRTKVWQGSHLL